MMHLIVTAWVLWLATVLNPVMALAGQTLDRVRANGAVRCGVSEGLAGFSIKDATGHWQGFNIDFCRAVAAAAFRQS